MRRTKRFVESVYRGRALEERFGERAIAAGSFHLPGKPYDSHTDSDVFGTTWRVERREDGLYRVVTEVFLWSDARDDAYPYTWRSLEQARSFVRETAMRLMEDLVKADVAGDSLVRVVNEWSRVPRAVGAKRDAPDRVLRQ